jgi:hypothetical protein
MTDMTGNSGFPESRRVSRHLGPFHASPRVRKSFRYAQEPIGIDCRRLDHPSKNVLILFSHEIASKPQTVKPLIFSRPGATSHADIPDLLSYNAAWGNASS